MCAEQWDAATEHFGACCGEPERIPIKSVLGTATALLREQRDIHHARVGADCACAWCVRVGAFLAGEEAWEVVR